MSSSEEPEEQREATFTPVSPLHFKETNERDEKMTQALMESIYSQSLGWVHTPPFGTGELIPGNLRVPQSREASLSSKLYFKKAFDPKVQVENKGPYGYFPKTVATDIERRRLARRNLTKILEVMGLDVDLIRPPMLRYRDYFFVSKTYIPEGMPTEPFLDLEWFDDEWMYETRLPKEWLDLGQSENEKRPVPGIALIPLDLKEDSRQVKLQWLKVGVLDYSDDNKLYLVRKEDLLSGKKETCDLWVPRIYLKFEAEDSLKFAERMRVAVHTRHLAEESLRLCYYVENMPVQQDVPCWSETDLNHIISVARQSRHLQPKLQWSKELTDNAVEEIKTIHKRVVNFMTYMNVTGQNPNLMADFENERFDEIQTPYSICETAKYGYSFKEKFEMFRGSTLYSQPEVIRALLTVQLELLNIEGMSLVDFNPDEITTLESFETMQRAAMRSVRDHMLMSWLHAIADAVTNNISSCSIGDYDLNQSVLHTFKLTKLGKLLQLIGYKMQDVMRSLHLKSLEKYVQLFRDACVRFSKVKDKFKWYDKLTSNRWLPLKRPVFEVDLEIKDTLLDFSVPLSKFLETVVDIFEESFEVMKNLPRVEKFVMKKLLYNPETKLDTVLMWEEDIKEWKESLVTGLIHANIVATAYTAVYEPTLKAFAEDQINYAKRLMRENATSDELKLLIKHHQQEGAKLSRTIPDFVDIGPFRLLTSTVRYTATKKHGQLGNAVINLFYDRFKESVEQLNDEFLVLLDNMEMATGNIEDLLEKKVWCRTVPKKVEKLAEEVNRLRADSRLLDLCNKNMEDEDFATFWRIQNTMRRLETRMQAFDEERLQHKTNLEQDTRELEDNIEGLKSAISTLGACRDPLDADANGTEVRRVRKGLLEAREQGEVLSKREHLFGLESPDRVLVADELSASLAPFEALWLSASEFLKYRQRSEAGELEMNDKELREKVTEFRREVERSVELEEGLSEVAEFFLRGMDAFLESKCGDY